MVRKNVKSSSWSLPEMTDIHSNIVSGGNSAESAHLLERKQHNESGGESENKDESFIVDLPQEGAQKNSNTSKKNDKIPSPLSPTQNIEKKNSLFSKLATILKVILIVGFVIAAIAFIIVSVVDENVKKYILQLLQWIRNVPPVYGCLITISATAIFTIVMFPSTPMNLAAGFLFGMMLGTAVVLAGCMIASIVAFYLGRTCLRSWVERTMSSNPKLKAVDGAVRKNAFLIIFLTRLSPVFPYPLLNYAYGGTKVDVVIYSVATFLGLAPGIAMYAYLGSQMMNLTDIISNHGHSSTAQLVWMGAGLVVTAVVVVIVTLVTRRALLIEMNKAEKRKKRRENKQLANDDHSSTDENVTESTAINSTLNNTGVNSYYQAESADNRGANLPGRPHQS